MKKNKAEDNSRTKFFLKNIFSNFTYNILLNVFRFISRIVFIKVLGKLYLGVNGLLSNVLGILALSELGIGTAISFSLYKPLLNKENEEINSLMKFYKKAYHIISLIVLILGLVILPFLPHFIKDTKGINNLNIIYLIFLVNMVIGYLFSYKRTLIIADQKNYKIMPILIFYNFLTTVLQILSLLLFKNYIIYLLMQTICIILENITVNSYIDKEYPFLDTNNAKKLSDVKLKKIKKDVKSLMFHKVGSYAVTSTDNLIISKYIGVITVGIYSNYSLIINTIASIIYVFINNMTSSFGNLIANGDDSKSYQVFKEVSYLYFIMYAISFVCFLNLMNPFIELVFGKDFLLSNLVVIVLIINFYLMGMTNIMDIVKSSAGIYNEDKYVSLLQAFINIVISIVLAIKLEILGVFIGTFISTLLPLIVKPIIVYKKVFKVAPINYFKTLLYQIFLIFLSSIISYFSLKYITLSPVLNIVVRLIISVLIPSIVIYIFTKNSVEYQSALNRLKFILRRKHD